MSNYKIYAKSGGKVMPIKIEPKHFYTHSIVNDELPIYVYKPVYNQNEENTVGLGVSKYNTYLIYNTNNIYIPQGTSEDQRVGNKVNIKSIAITLYIYFNSTPLIANFSHGQMIDTWFNFRIMSVKFDQQMTTTDLAQWYRDTFIYYRTVSVSGGDKYPFQSNYMDKLRESTPWTGSFNILYDKKIKMTKFNSALQLSFSIPFSGNVNFDNTNNKPTDNQGINNIYTFIIGPSNVFLDMDPVSADKCLVLGTGESNLFYYNSNIKLIYYDV